jgi:1-acyl-sn-glycerol-3-phosphate acyltransferase
MFQKCLVGSIGHFIFFGVLVALLIPGYIIYLVAHLFVKEPKYVFQRGSSICYEFFFFLAPSMKLKRDLLDDIPKSAIYVSTHQSILDFPALSTFIRDYLNIANVNLGRYPMVAEVCDLAGIRYIKGKNLGEVSEIYDEFEDHLRNGKNAIFFPEGTRHEGDKLKPFKRGAFRLAKKTNKPVIPIVVEGPSRLLPRKSFCFKTTKTVSIHVKMLEPLYPENFSSDVEMMHYAQKIMQKEKDRLCDIF